MRGKSQPAPERDSIQTLIAIQRGGHWHLAGFQNTRVRPMGRRRPGSYYMAVLRLAVESVWSKEEEVQSIRVFLRDCSRATGFLQPVHDGVLHGCVDGLPLGPPATSPRPDAHGSALASTPARPFCASCACVGSPAPPPAMAPAVTGRPALGARAPAAGPSAACGWRPPLAPRPAPPQGGACVERRLGPLASLTPRVDRGPARRPLRSRGPPPTGGPPHPPGSLGRQGPGERPQRVGRAAGGVARVCPG